MRITISLIFLFLLSVKLNSAFAEDKLQEETYIKVGVFDYIHQTDMYVVNRKKVTDNYLNIKYLGELTQIYDLMLMGDVREGYSDKATLKERGEYAIYFSSGYQKNFNLSENVIFTPSFSVGLYEAFDQGKEMGLPVEFKTEIELNYKTKNDLIFNVTYNHISNADIGNTNPGSDNFLVGFRYKTN